jgi:hypothetical protein
MSKRCPAIYSILFAFAIVFAGCSEKDGSKSPAPPSQTVEKTGAPENAPDSSPDSDTAESSSINNDGVSLGNSNDAFAAPSRTAPRPVAIPGGRTLTVRLLQTISSRSANTGQHFEAELSSPVVVNGKTVLPKRTPLRGRVVAARSSGRLHKPGYLRLTLDSLRTPDGRWVPVKTTSIWAQGNSHKKRNLTLIGGGTGLGAVIGAVAGGGKGAAIGAAAGAGAGTAGAYATGKKDVTFPVERKLSFATVREVLIS